MSSMNFDRTNNTEAGADPAQDHFLHAAEAEEAQAYRSRQQDHGGEQERTRQQLLVLQPVTGRDQPSPLRHVDIEGQLPKRHGFRGGKTLPHLFGRQVGGKTIGVPEHRRIAARINAGFLEPPIALIQRRALCLDPFLEFAGVIEGVNADAPELRTLLAARLGVDDGRAVGAFLTHPEAAGVFLQGRAGKLAHHLGFKALGALVQHGSERVVKRGGDGAEQERRNERWRHKLPGGNACGARYDQLQAARQPQIARHRSHQHRERHDALGELGDAERGNLGEDQGRSLRPVGAAAQQFDVVDHRRERDHAEERADDRS